MDQVNMSQDYCKNSRLQSNVHSSYLPQIKQAVQEMIEKDPHRFTRSEEPFVIADLGCADGKNSIGTLQTIIQLVRTANPNLPITIYLTDTPSNDFTRAMKTVTEGLQNFSDICIFSSGKTFYDRLFPQKSIDLFLSFTSLHWCSKRPTKDLKNLIHFLTEENIHTPSSQIMLQVALEDWKSFVTNREKELKSNGRLLVSTFTTHKNMKSHDKNFMYMFDVLGETMNSTLIDHGLSHLQNKIIMNMVCRQEDHYRKAFEDKETALELLQYHMYDVKDPLGDAYETDKDLEKYASKYGQWVRGFSEGVYRAELQREGVSKEQVDRILRDFYNLNVPTAFMGEFEKYVGYMTFNLMVIEKLH